MKRVAVALCFLIVAIVAVPAHADLDPGFGLGDPNCSSVPQGANVTSVTGPFYVTPVNGGGVFYFCNQSGTLWTQFDVVVPIVPNVITASTVTCTVDGFPRPFGPCFVSTIGNFVDIFFSPNNSTFNGQACGIPNDFFLYVDLNCNNIPNCQPWPANSPTITLNPNGTPGSAIAFSPVPEPTSLLLLGTGFGALWRRYRRQRLT